MILCQANYGTALKGTVRRDMNSAVNKVNDSFLFN